MPSMWLPPSYDNGFAPRDGESAYPEVWARIYGSWCPMLGCMDSQRLLDNAGANDGVLTNVAAGANLTAAWKAPEVNGLTLDGTNDTVEFPLSIGPFGGDYSISVWIYPTSSPGELTFFSIFSSNAAVDATVLEWGDGTTATKIRALHRRGSSSTDLSSSALTANRWNHIVLTHSGSSTIVYTNGRADGSGSTAGNGTFTVAANHLGNFGFSGANRYFAGGIGELTEFYGAISASEVATLNFLGPGGIYALADRMVFAAQAAVASSSARRIINGGLAQFSPTLGGRAF